MRLAFICEGKTEKKIVESQNFQRFLASISHACLPEIIDAQGNGRLKPEALFQIIQRLISKGAEKIIILTDLDTDSCITLTKDRIDKDRTHITIVAVKTIEAWFLSDDTCMSTICKSNIHFELPENENQPFETIRSLLIQHTGKGIGDKILLAAKMLNNNFSVVNAAGHPNCNSAKYFINKLKTLDN